MAAYQAQMTVVFVQAPDFPDLLHCPDLPQLQHLMPVLPAFQLLITPCTAKGSGSHLKRGLLNCTCFTVKLQSPMGVVYQMPSMESLEGLTLFEAQAGRYRQHWQTVCPGEARPHKLGSATLQWPEVPDDA